jgi:hypothetical protein
LEPAARFEDYRAAMPNEKNLKRKVGKVMVGTTVLTFLTLMIGYQLLF